MCTVSMIVRESVAKWPVEDWERLINKSPAVAIERWNSLQKAINILNELDRLLEQPDCEEFLKEAYLTEVRRLIDKVKEKVEKI